MDTANQSTSPADFRIRPFVFLPLKSAADFNRVYQTQGEQAGLFVPGRQDLKVGAKVDIEIAFADEHVVCHTRGRVKWKRASASDNLGQGVGVEFLESEFETLEKLQAFADGKEVAFVERQSRRYPAILEVKIHAGSKTILGITVDLSKHGACLLLEEPLKTEAEVQIEFRIRGDEVPPVQLNAACVWSSHARSMAGLEFRGGGSRDLQKFLELIRSIQIKVSELT